MPNERDDENTAGQAQQGQYTAQGGQQSQADAQNSAQEGFNDQETQGNQRSFSGGSESLVDTLTQQSNDLGQGAGSTGSQESFGQSDEPGSGFMAQQGTGSDDFLQDNIGQGDLAQEDSLTQESDGGVGEAASEESGR